MTTRKTPESRPEVLTSEKVMQTFRMPRELVSLLKAEAARKGLDLTALVVRLLHGYLTDFGLPLGASAQLDADRGELGLDREQYIAHVLYQRSVDVRNKDPGFDMRSRERKGR